jgi:hypothetical protein
MLMIPSRSNRICSGTDYEYCVDGGLKPEPLQSGLPPVVAFSEKLLPVSTRPLLREITERMKVPMDLPSGGDGPLSGRRSHPQGHNPAGGERRRMGRQERERYGRDGSLMADVAQPGWGLVT